MWQVEVLGELPSSISSLRGVVKKLPKHCWLRWVAHLEEEQVTGPPPSPMADPAVGCLLLSALDGAYELWHETGSRLLNCQVLIVERQVLIEGQVVLDLVREDPFIRKLPGHVRKGLAALLDTSEKQVRVYERPGYGEDQRYLMIWPGDDPPPEHPAYPGFVHVGQADLKTGEVRQ